tara:strand:- start:1132 stop:1257 length:126 start_codon:yes stop_codon:yes gene_type:complete
MIPSGPIPEVDIVTVLAVTVIFLFLLMFIYSVIKENHFRGK